MNIRKKLSCISMLIFTATICFAVNSIDHTAKIYLPVDEQTSVSATTGGEFEWEVSGSINIVSQQSGSCEIQAGNTVGTGTVKAKDKKGNVCESWNIEVFEVKIRDFGGSVCDGTVNIAVNIDIQPASVPISDIKLEAKNSTGGSDFKNISMSGLSFTGTGKNQRIQNARWYALTDNSCDSSATYKIGGSFKVDGQSYDIKEEKDFMVNAGANCVNGSANFLSWCSGTPESTQKEVVDQNNQKKWEVKFTGNAGTFTRNVQTSITMATLGTSQFYQMVQAEEEFHCRQMKGTAGSVLSPNLYWVQANVLNQLRGQTFTASSLSAAQNDANIRFSTSVRDEERRTNSIVFPYPGSV